MIAFASNSLLCRLALKQTNIDAASFTFVRIVSGALALWLIRQGSNWLMVDRTAPPLADSSADSSLVTHHRSLRSGDWLSAFALFVYAAAFSFAYLSLPAGTGALLLFGAVQGTMILWGFRAGESLRARQLAGLAIALSGLVALLFPGLSAPPLFGSILMLGAGVAWGVYSLRGKAQENPIAATAGNFLRAVPFALVLGLVLFASLRLDRLGLACGVLSGAIASGIGYILWYAVLPGLKAMSAATVQLSVPVLTAAGGILLLGETPTLRFLFASIAILGGIALVVINPARERAT